MLKQNWCFDDSENFPQKPTAIFSNIQTFPSNLYSEKGQKHPIQVQVIDFPNAAALGKYRPQFLDFRFDSFHDAIHSFSDEIRNQEMSENSIFSKIEYIFCFLLEKERKWLVSKIFFE